MQCVLRLIYLLLLLVGLESFVLALAGAFFLAFVAFFFAAVAGYIAGGVLKLSRFWHDHRHAPVLAGLVYIIGDVFLGMAKQDLMFATLLIAAIVASSAAIAGDVMQDLKTSHMLGATPKRQQVAEIIGVLTGAVVIGPSCRFSMKRFASLQTACQLNPLPNDPTCSNALFAPAELIGAIVQEECIWWRFEHPNGGPRCGHCRGPHSSADACYERRHRHLPPSRAISPHHDGWYHLPHPLRSASPSCRQ